jgi:hypothetical protein
MIVVPDQEPNIVEMNKVLIMAGALSILTTSCIKSIFCIDGNGRFETDFRNTSPFTGAVNTTSVDLIFTKADSFSITVYAESNLFPHIITLINNGKLEVRTDPRNACFNYSRKPFVRVTSPRLDLLELTGSGDITADSLSGNAVVVKLTGSGDALAGFVLSDELELTLTGSGDANIERASCTRADVALTGSGDLNVRGTSANGIMRVTGSGDIKASEFSIETANETITGSGNIHTLVTRFITAVISGSGNIYVKGNPTINQTVTGSGRVVKE